MTLQQLPLRAFPCSKALVVFSGFNIRAVVAVCRFAKARGIPVWLIASGPLDPILLTDFSVDVVFVRNGSKLVARDLIQAITEARRNLGELIPVVMPTTEFLNRFLIANRAEFTEHEIEIPIVATDLYQRLSDKSSFAQLCAENDLDIPSQVDSVPSTLPFVAKPKHYSGSDGSQLKPQLVFTESDRDAFLSIFSTDEFFYQEYIDGESHYLFYCISGIQRERDVLFSQQNLIQQTGGGSILLARGSTIHKQPIAQAYRNLLVQLGYRGIVMIEVRGMNGKYQMIEANPRLWGPLQFIVDRKPELLESFLLEIGVQAQTYRESTDACKPEYYYWSGGYTKSSQSLMYHRFGPGEFAEQFSEIRSCDVFCRPDTIRLHQRELNV